MEYTQAQLRSCAINWLASEARRQTIRDLAQAWSHRDHGPRRYAKLYEDPNLTIWLLGWRPGESVSDHAQDVTPIHGHGLSAAYIACLQGEIDHDSYGIIPQDAKVGDVLSCEVTSTVLYAGLNTYIPPGTVHEMRCDERDGRGFALSLQLYSPRLLTMTYYEAAGEWVYPARQVRLVDTWTDPDPDVLVPSVA